MSKKPYRSEFEIFKILLEFMHTNGEVKISHVCRAINASQGVADRLLDVAMDLKWVIRTSAPYSARRDAGTVVTYKLSTEGIDVYRTFAHCFDIYKEFIERYRGRI